MRDAEQVMRRRALCLEVTVNEQFSIHDSQGQGDEGSELLRVLQRTDPKICSQQVAGSGDPMM